MKKKNTVYRMRVFVLLRFEDGSVYISAFNKNSDVNAMGSFRILKKKKKKNNNNKPETLLRAVLKHMNKKVDMPYRFFSY